MKLHYSIFFVVFLFAVLFTSCVSKKKYLSLQKENTAKETSLVLEKQRLKTQNDSLSALLVAKDSLIDSLNIKLGEVAMKKEKEKGKPSAKKSTLTKEQEYDKKSLFIYNFTKHIEWPIEYNGTEFIIGVASDEKVLKQLQEFMLEKKVSGKKIIVEKYKKGKKYNLVFVAASENGNFQAIKNANQKNKTLIVSDDNLSGCHISFIIDQDKIRYIVDKIGIEKTGLKVGQELMRYSG